MPQENWENDSEFGNCETESNSTTFHTTYTGRTRLINGLIEENNDLREELEETKESLKKAKERLTKFTNSREIIAEQIEKAGVELETMKNNCLKKHTGYSREKLEKN